MIKCHFVHIRVAHMFFLGRGNIRWCFLTLSLLCYSCRDEHTGASLPEPTAPFIPLLQLRSATVLAANDIPYEPTVPGQSTRHCTVSAFSCLLWFSSWHAELLLGFITQMQQVVQQHISAFHVSPQGAGAAAQDGTRAVGKDSADETSLQAGLAASLSSKPCTGTPAHSTGSRLSLLLDLPLVSLALLAEVPHRSTVDKQDTSAESGWVLPSNSHCCCIGFVSDSCIHA